MASGPAASLDLRPGARLGDFEIVGTIAIGATGAVYRARDMRTGADVAMKLMLEPAHRGRFEIETRLLSALSHPRVVKVLDYVTGRDGAVAIAMELIEGTDLSRVLWDRGTPGLPVESAIRWVSEACEALDYLSEQQIVHGDVKPRNLLVGRDGIVLTDFGAASQLGTARAATISAGTPMFMAPEVFAGDPVSPASDVYGIAATLWTLLTGSPPAYGEGAALSGTVAGVTPELEEALSRALAVNPAERTQSAGELAAAIGAPSADGRGASLARCLDRPGIPRVLIEGVVRTAAGVFEAAAASIALVEEPHGDLLYVAAWGAGADEALGMRLSKDLGIAGAVAASGRPQAIASCRSDARFASQLAEATGYVPYTMLVLPLRRGERTVGVLSVLDRRDGEPYLPCDIPRGSLFCDLAVEILDSA
jgi:predicted Ser/Thr protein kinase